MKCKNNATEKIKKFFSKCFTNKLGKGNDNLSGRCWKRRFFLLQCNHKTAPKYRFPKTVPPYPTLFFTIQRAGYFFIGSLHARRFAKANLRTRSYRTVSSPTHMRDTKTDAEYWHRFNGGITRSFRVFVKVNCYREAVSRYSGG